MTRWEKFDFPFQVATRYYYCHGDIICATLIVLRPACVVATIVGWNDSAEFSDITEAMVFVEVQCDDRYVPAANPALVSDHHRRRELSGTQRTPSDTQARAPQPMEPDLQRHAVFNGTGA